MKDDLSYLILFGPVSGSMLCKGHHVDRVP